MIDENHNQMFYVNLKLFESFKCLKNETWHTDHVTFDRLKKKVKIVDYIFFCSFLRVCPNIF